MRRKRWFGIALCVLAVLAGILIVGSIIVGIKALFGIDDDAERHSVVNWIFLLFIPLVIHSVLGGAIGAAITWAIYRGSDLMDIARISAWIYSILFIGLFAISFSQKGWQFLHLEMFIQMFGIWGGLLGTTKYLLERPPRG